MPSALQESLLFKPMTSRGVLWSIGLFPLALTIATRGVGWPSIMGIFITLRCPLMASIFAQTELKDPAQLPIWVICCQTRTQGQTHESKTWHFIMASFTSCQVITLSII